MKKLLSLLGMLIVALSTFAQTFTVGDLTYYVTSTTNKTVQVSNGKNATGDVIVPETVTYNDVEYSVTAIGYQAFYQNAKIISVSMPSVTSIGSSAFYNCTSLTTASLPAATSIGSSAFYQCSNITSLRIGSVEQWCSVQLPSSYASYASPLCQSSQNVDLYIGDSEAPATSIEVPSAVTEIPDYAFCSTTITSVSAPAATSIGSAAFSSCSSLTSASIPAATAIGSFAFSSCTSLTSASLPAATSIGDYTFRGCESLEKAIMPKVETIGRDAFTYEYINSTYHYCKALKYVDLSSVKTIGSEAFRDCSGITSLRIGSVEQWCSVQLPSSNAYYASPLYQSSQKVDLYIGDSETPATSIVVPSTITEIPDYAFCRTTITSLSTPTVTSIGSSAFSNCSCLTSVALPAATSIGSKAFGGCSGISSLRIGSVEQWCGVQLPSSDAYSASPLYQSSQSVDLYIGDSETPATSIEVPSAVTKIPQYAFSRTTIKSISAPAATSIGSYAFYNCTSLTSTSLPAATSIGSEAFYYCTSLTSASLPAATFIGYQAFYNCTSLTSVSLPAVTYIGSYAFWYCSNISILRISNVEQWCNVNFNDSYSNPLYVSSKSVALYIGDSETPASSIEVPSTVTKIPDYAFSRTTITSVSAPSATSVGSSAFSYCTSLTSASFPSATSIGSIAFRGCTSLSSASLLAATSIGSYAFQSCTSLASANLPAAISIGYNAFSECSNISTLRIGSVEQWCGVNFSNSDSNPLYVLSTSKYVDLYIGDSETPATEIILPKTIQKIPENAFLRTGIHTIHFERTTPPALRNKNSFPEWTMLAVPEEAYETYLAADVYNTIPLRITVDGHLDQDVEVTAANGTSNLLEKIGEDEVKYVVNLKVSGTINSYDMLIIRNQMTSLRNLDLTDASIVDCDYIYSNANGTNYHSQKDVITGDWLGNVMNLKLPATIKTIGSRALYYNSRLQTVNIPDGVTSIGSEAFSGCSKITECILPQHLKSIGGSAFKGCYNLMEISIPNCVTTIETSTFSDCCNLTKVTIPESVKAIRGNAFSNCGPLELHIHSLKAWNEMNIGGGIISFSSGAGYDGAFRNINKLYIGDSAEPVENIIIPEGITEIKENAFAGFKCIKSVMLPKSLTYIRHDAFRYCSGISEIILPECISEIESSAFSECGDLENIVFADKINGIGSYAFYNCSKLTKLELPAYLKTIGSYAFSSCSNLTEVVIPASLTNIADYAFEGCSKMNTVIATTVEPIRINQNTFSTYKTATLYSPKTSYYKYYWNTQYNQFLSRKEYDKEFAKVFGYKYFYLNGQNGDNSEDFVISDETGPIQGVDDKAPDADFYEGAGLVVGGEQVQNLGDIHLHHNGNNGASIIAKGSGKVHIDNLYVDIKTQKNRWYFFCFPFDVNTEDATFDGSHVWYLYDGEARALNGNGGWKKTAVDGVMAAGNGYIFQGAQNGTLTIHVSDLTVDTSDSKTNMITYASDNKNDASWNLIGNPSMAYYDMDNLGYDAPITVYDNNTGNYEAVRPGDDQYEFYPFQAFFVQKPEGVDAMNFEADKKETKNMADKKKPAAKAKAKAIAMRKVINLEIVAADEANDSVAAPTDRTRIVVNPMKTTAYEPECDAAKFIADGIPQIYSLDNEGSKYAINERPVEDGIIALAVKADKEGIYTISAPRLDCAAKLRDLDAETEIDLAEGGYTFMAEAKTYTNRFQLILGSNIATGITTPEEAQAAISVEAGAINIADSNADVKVYTVSGSLVASQKGAGTVSVPAGTYVVNVNGQSIKVNVNE